MPTPPERSWDSPRREFGCYPPRRQAGPGQFGQKTLDLIGAIYSGSVSLR